MINDLVDLDRVLDQYDAGRALVGPVLSLSINSSFRFFYIAGNGAKIYQSIGLGFIEAETEAELQRGDIVAKLQSRFGEVKVLNSQLEMAREANALWPNEETVRFLATAAIEAKLQPMQVDGRDETPASDIGVQQSDQCKSAIDEATAESITLADAIGSILTSGLASIPAQEVSTPPPDDTAQPARLPSAYESWPLNSDPANTPQSRHAALEHDDIALAVLHLKSPPETGADEETAAATVPIAETSADHSAKQSGRSASMIYRLCAFSGVAALIAGIVVVTSTRHIAKEASPEANIAGVAAAAGTGDRSQTTGSVILSAPPTSQPPAQAAETVRSQAAAVPNSQSAPSPAASARAVPATNEPPSQAPKASLPQIGAPHVSEPQSPSSQITSAQVSAPPVSEPHSSSPPAAVNTREATPPYAPSSRASEAPRAQAKAAPDLAQSSPSKPSGAHVGSHAVSQPQSPSAPMDEAQAATVSDPSASRAPDAPRAQASAPPRVTSEPQPPPRMASAEVGTPRAATPEPPAATATGGAKTPLSADELDALLSRSSAFLKNGDFAAARILLRRAAESGSADAALMLGKTFDPIYLNELGAMGIQPDIAQARHWYQRAVELGSDAAAQRLANLAQKGQ